VQDVVTGVVYDGTGIGHAPGNRLGASVDKNYSSWPGVTIDSLTSTAGWSLTQTNGSITADTMSDGSACLKFFANGSGGPNLFMTKDIGDVRYDSSTSLGAWIEVSDPGIIASIEVVVSNEAGGTFTNWRIYKFGGSGGAVFRGQRYFAIVNTANATLGGGSPATAGSWKSFRIRVTSSYQSHAGWIKISNLMVAPTTRPKVCITFDDGFASQYYEAFRYM
jgi:hypothetical protein